MQMLCTLVDKTAPRFTRREAEIDARICVNDQQVAQWFSRERRTAAATSGIATPSAIVRPDLGSGTAIRSFRPLAQGRRKMAWVPTRLQMM